MPHDHRMWAVIGVYPGREDNISWRRVAGEAGGLIEAAAGVVRLTYRDRRSPKQDARSHCRHRTPPFARRFGSKDPQR